MAGLVHGSGINPQLRNAFEYSSVSGIDATVRTHFHYRPEAEEVVRTPAFMWNDWQTVGYFEGDCDDVSVMVASICDALSIPCRFVAIRQSDNPEFEHVFVEAWNELGHWQIIDPTVDQGTEYHEAERMVLAL